MTLALDLWILLMGPVAGSYVTALADRHCRGQSLLYGRSHCASCGATIAPRDLVPLVSYPLLGGRCRACGAAIPVSVYAGEWAGLALAGLSLAAGEGPLDRLLLAGFLLTLLGLFQADRACLRLPDALTLPLFALGLALGSRTDGLVAALLAGAAGAGALWLIARAYRWRLGRTGLGLGDVKMMAGLSAAVGLAQIPWVTLLAAAGALAAAVVRQGGPAKVSGTEAVRFGCYLAVAGAAVLLWR